MSLITSSPNQRDSSFLGAAMKKLQLWHYQYEVTFSLYILTPAEKIILNSIVLSLFSLLVYCLISFAPEFIIQFCAKAVSSVFWVYINDSVNELIVNNTTTPLANTTTLRWEPLGHYKI